MASRIEVEAIEIGSNLEVTVRGAMDVASAAQLKELLVATLVPPRDVVLHLAGVERFDGAGLQLLLATKAHVEHDGHTFAVGSVADVVRRALEVAGAAPIIFTGGVPPLAN